MFLTEDDLERITERKRYSAQVKVLARRGIPFDVAPSGRPLVLRRVYETRLGGGSKDSPEPDFGAIVRRK